MTKIFPNLYIGDSSDEHNAELLMINNISTIVNTAKDLDPTPLLSHIKYYKVNLIDGPGNSLNDYLDGVSLLIFLTLRINTFDDLRFENILVCCHEGASRSPSLVIMLIAYSMVLCENKGIEEAIESAKKKVFECREVCKKINVSHLEVMKSVLLRLLPSKYMQESSVEVKEIELKRFLVSFDSNNN